MCSWDSFSFNISSASSSSSIINLLQNKDLSQLFFIPLCLISLHSILPLQRFWFRLSTWFFLCDDFTYLQARNMSVTFSPALVTCMGKASFSLLRLVCVLSSVGGQHPVIPVTCQTATSGVGQRLWRQMWLSRVVAVRKERKREKSRGVVRKGREKWGRKEGGREREVKREGRREK